MKGWGRVMLKIDRRGRSWVGDDQKIQTCPESVPPTPYLIPPALSSRWTVLKPGGLCPHSKEAKGGHLNPGLLQLPLEHPGPFCHLMLGLTMEGSTLTHEFSWTPAFKVTALAPGPWV